MHSHTTTNSQNSFTIHQPYQRSLEETSEVSENLSINAGLFPRCGHLSLGIESILSSLLYVALFLLFDPWIERPIHLSSAHSRTYAEAPEIKESVTQRRRTRRSLGPNGCSTAMFNRLVF